jgi:hypothetical protein
MASTSALVHVVTMERTIIRSCDPLSQVPPKLVARRLIAPRLCEYGAAAVDPPSCTLPFSGALELDGANTVTQLGECHSGGSWLGRNGQRIQPLTLVRSSPVQTDSTSGGIRPKTNLGAELPGLALDERIPADARSASSGALGSGDQRRVPTVGRSERRRCTSGTAADCRGFRPAGARRRGDGSAGAAAGRYCRLARRPRRRRCGRGRWAGWWRGLAYDRACHRAMQHVCPLRPPVDPRGRSAKGGGRATGLPTARYSTCRRVITSSVSTEPGQAQWNRLRVPAPAVFPRGCTR